MTAKKIQATAQQATFLMALTEGTENLALVARAGTGKTSTIMMGVDAYLAKRPSAEVLVCAYNKAIEIELTERLKAAGHDWRRAQAKTVHALGFGLLKDALGLSRDSIDDRKLRKLIQARNEPTFQEYGDQIEKLVRYAKQAGFGFFPELSIDRVGAWHDLADHYDVNGLDDSTDMERVVAAAQAIYRASLELVSTIDFDDMVLLPLIRNLRVKYGKDLVMVDEAQDLSRARQALIRKFVKRDGRIVIVGDDRQAIYGFSGADAAALPNLIQQLGCRVLPLTVTWRCPQAVVRLAQRLVPDLEAAPGAAEGEVLDSAMPEDLTAGDAILCRNTAPLITQAYRLIRRGVAAKVEGRAIGEGLLKLVGRWKIRTVDALINRLNEYKDREVQKALARGSEAKAEEAADRADTLLEICAACSEAGQTSIDDVRARVEALFADGPTACVVLATYHRAKGREWDRVVLFEHRTRCPSKAARQEWQLRQEENLAYVAFTRAKRTLVLVG